MDPFKFAASDGPASLSKVEISTQFRGAEIGLHQLNLGRIPLEARICLLASTIAVEGANAVSLYPYVQAATGMHAGVGKGPY